MLLVHIALAAITSGKECVFCTESGIRYDLSSLPGATWEAYKQLGNTRRHAEFCCMLFEYPLNIGARYVHGQPLGTRPWDMDVVTKLTHNKDVMIAMVEHCRCWLDTSGEDGSTGPARERTGLMSLSWTVIEELDGACNGMH